MAKQSMAYRTVQYTASHAGGLVIEITEPDAQVVERERAMHALLFVDLVEFAKSIATRTHNLSLVLARCICSQRNPGLPNKTSPVAFRTSVQQKIQSYMQSCNDGILRHCE